MNWKLKYLPEAAKDLKNLAGNQRLMVIKAIDKVLQNPFILNNSKVEPATLINTNIKYASRNLSAGDKIKRSLGLTIILMTVKNIVPKAR